MSYFTEAYEITMGHEGGYVNDPDDAGGETYKGIARKFNSSWEGWKLIDEAKKDDTANFPACLGEIKELQELVPLFYKAKYFDPFNGDAMPRSLAIEMFDTSVNMGASRAVQFLQTALNLLNRNGTMYRDMLVDGAYGPTTERYFNAYMEQDGDETILLKMLNVMQGNHYINYMRSSPTQEKYARGWFKRVEISKRPMHG